MVIQLKGHVMFERHIVTEVARRLPLSKNQYYVNMNGEIKDYHGNVLKPDTDISGNSIVYLNWIKGWQWYKVAELVAFTYKPLHLPIKFWGELTVMFADGNIKNFHPSNLVWKYPIGLGSDEYNGFAFIPMYSKYIINKEGIIKEWITDKILNCYFNKGYYSYSIFPDIGERTSLKRHRGICLAFKDYPNNVDNMEVNHIDGISGKDDLLNLEWVTKSQNRVHAIKNNLTLVNKPIIIKNLNTNEITELNSLTELCQKFKLNEKQLSINLSTNDKHYVYRNFKITYKFNKHATLENTNKTPILVRDIKTGNITKYDSIASCSKQLNISKDIINWRINTPTSSLYKDYLQFKRESDQTQWYIPLDYEQELLDFSWSKVILIKDLNNNNISEFKTQREAAKNLGISESTLYTWVSQKNQPVFKNLKTGNLIQIKNKSDKTDWRIVNNPLKEYNDKLITKNILVRNIETKKIIEYPSAVECSKQLNILPTTLNWRLKSNGQKVYPDDLQFKYKSDPTPWLNVDKKLQKQ